MTDDLDLALHRLTGRPDVAFRSGQREAVEALAIRRERVLLVQRTGWGKSAVYFLATRLLRDGGLGPTLLVSPLLALMRNQLVAAERLGLRAYTINSAADTRVSEIADLLAADEIDLLLISPERLANPEFAEKVMPLFRRRPGLVVIDEAHCISDWGHDFRPDYRRLGQMIDGLPAGFPVLGCTATANNRVVEDVASQLGVTMNILRGPLTRDGLSLQVIEMPDAAERLCWLDHHLADLPGSGIIYCLTIDDTRRVAEWLAQRGHTVMAYTGQLDNDVRLDAEAALQANTIKALVATTALGMGYDKPDLGFVVHFQSPGSPVAYYQQVGRAGRALESSYAVLLRGTEDAQIQDWFIQQAFPAEPYVDEVIAAFHDARGPLSLTAVEDAVNMRRSTLELVLKQLSIEGALTRLKAQTYERTSQPWAYPRERVAAVTAARRAEQREMIEYARTTACRMQFLARLLDDATSGPCGVCDVCAQPQFRDELDPVQIAAARHYLRQGHVTIEPRKKLVTKALPDSQRLEPGRALCAIGDRGWGQLVAEGRDGGTQFDHRLIDATAAMVGEWSPSPPPSWITWIPSHRNPALVADLAHRLGAALGLPVVDVLRKIRDTPRQRGMQNSAHQFANVEGAYEVTGPVPPGPAFLVDDLVDSRWTITEVARTLRNAGAERVYPLALASTLGRDS